MVGPRGEPVPRSETVQTDKNRFNKWVYYRIKFQKPGSQFELLYFTNQTKMLFIFILLTISRDLLRSPVNQR